MEQCKSICGGMELTYNEKGEIEFIDNNIFYKDVTSDKSKECALWILENESKVKRKIRGTFSSMGHAEADLEECYDYLIYYFMEFTDKAFDENYFVNLERAKLMEEAKIDGIDNIKELEELEKELNDIGEPEYKMEYYLMNRVKHIAMSYIRELNKSRDILRYNADDLNDGVPKNSNTISLELASANINGNEQIQNIYENPNDYIEHSDIWDKYENELSIYDEEFQSKGLADFDTKEFITAMFLKGLKDEYEVSEYMGVTPAVINNYTSGFRKIVETESHMGGEYYDLMCTITDLIEALKGGWNPDK